MVLHVLKNDPALRELEHVQMDGPETAYLFFYDRNGHCGLIQKAMLKICSHLAEAFSEWIEWSAHYEVSLLSLNEGCRCADTTIDRRQICIQTQEPMGPPFCVTGPVASDSSTQLVGESHQCIG